MINGVNRYINTFFKNRCENTKCLGIIFIFYSHFIMMILSGYTFLDDNDDLIVWSFLN